VPRAGADGGMLYYGRDYNDTCACAWCGEAFKWGRGYGISGAALAVACCSLACKVLSQEKGAYPRGSKGDVVVCTCGRQYVPFRKSQTHCSRACKSSANLALYKQRHAAKVAARPPKPVSVCSGCGSEYVMKRPKTQRFCAAQCASSARKGAAALDAVVRVLESAARRAAE
jgi:hypothetical protein